MANHPNRKKRGPKNNSSQAHKVWAEQRMNARGVSTDNHSAGWEFISAFAASVRSMLKGLKPNRAKVAK